MSKRPWPELKKPSAQRAEGSEQRAEDGKHRAKAGSQHIVLKQEFGLGHWIFEFGYYLLIGAWNFLNYSWTKRYSDDQYGWV